jgi:hypothetical protein
MGRVGFVHRRFNTFVVASLISTPVRRFRIGGTVPCRLPGVTLSGQQSADRTSAGSGGAVA